MVARWICAEGNVIQECVCRVQTLMHRRQQPALPTAPANAQFEDKGKQNKVYLRAPTAKELLRDELLASAKVRAEKLNPTTASTFSLVNQEFSKLSERRQHEFERPSELLRSIARVNRRKRGPDQAEQRKAILGPAAFAHASLIVVP